MWDERTKTLTVGDLRVKAATENAARVAAESVMAFPLDPDPSPEAGDSVTEPTKARDGDTQ